MSTEYHQLAIDGSALARRLFFRRPPGDISAEVSALIARFRPKACVVCWEGPPEGPPAAAFRRALWPQYKAKRSATYREWPERAAFEAWQREQRAQIRIWQCWSPGYEGDDCLATVARAWPGRTLIVSPDHDMLQACGDRADALRKERPESLTLAQAAHEADIMALIGCDTDGVPGLVGIGRAAAERALERAPGLVGAVLSGNVSELTGIQDKTIARACAESLRCVCGKGCTSVWLTRQLTALYTVPLDFA